MEKIRVLPKGKQPKIRICFDIDGTLITEEHDPKPRYDIINLLRWFKNNGHTVFVWSGGGVDYAEMWVRKLGLDVKVLPKDRRMMKLDIAVDDCEAELAPCMIYVGDDKPEDDKGEIPIEYLNLAPRTYNTLLNAKITTVQKLLKNYHDLHLLQGIGHIALKDIDTRLIAGGHRLPS